MKFYLTYLKDVLGNNYLGLKIPVELITPYLNELKDIIGEDDFKVYTENQKKRDHSNYHITVINVADYNRLSSELGIDKFINSLEPIFQYEIDDLKMYGVGTANKNENRAYFVVCKSDKLEAIRDRFNLPKFDFHITLGFKWKDVFGVPKNQLITKDNKFLKLLRIEYYKKDNWNFLRSISNFEASPDSEIIPVEITDNRLKVKCDKYYMDIGLLDNEKFWVVTKYPIDKELPKLSETEIAKTLNKR